MARLREITIVEDRTAESRCDQGFLRLRRLRLRNEYTDGTRSEVYDCDVVSRRGVDAVVAVIYEIDEQRRVQVLLREGIRAPIYLRKDKTFVQPDPRTYTSLLELVAGIVEQGDPPGDEGLCHRAAVEAREEAGLDVPARRFTVLGVDVFASPGTTDEKLFFCAAGVPLADADIDAADGDGSVMEQGADLRTMELGEAITACRQGVIPDMKTEVGLLRLADHLGYVPQLGCFIADLPHDRREAYDRLGVAPAADTPST